MDRIKTETLNNMRIFHIALENGRWKINGNTYQEAKAQEQRVFNKFINILRNESIFNNDSNNNNSALSNLSISIIRTYLDRSKN